MERIQQMLSFVIMDLVCMCHQEFLNLHVKSILRGFLLMINVVKWNLVVGHTMDFRWVNKMKNSIFFYIVIKLNAFPYAWWMEKKYKQLFLSDVNSLLYALRNEIRLMFSKSIGKCQYWHSIEFILKCTVVWEKNGFKVISRKCWISFCKINTVKFINFMDDKIQS